MVTSGTSRRSTRPRKSFGSTPSGSAAACSSVGRRELVRHRELAHRDLDLHARIVDRAEHLDHAADRLHVALRLLQDLDDDDLPRLGREGGARRHEDFLLDALVLGDHDGDAALVQQAADELVGAALDDLDDLAFGTAAAVGPGDPGEHAVAVQHLAHLVLGQHEVLGAVVADQEAEAVAMALHLPGEQVGARGNQQQPGAVAHDAPGAFEFLDLRVERRPGFLGVQREPFGQVGRGQRCPGCRQRLQDGVGADLG